MFLLCKAELAINIISEQEYPETTTGWNLPSTRNEPGTYYMLSHKSQKAKDGFWEGSGSM